jgi:hypothetical protein
MGNAATQENVDRPANIAARRPALAGRFGECSLFPSLFGNSLPQLRAYDAWHG